MKKRYLVDDILRDLDEKMVFIGGARQVGKTCMAKYIAENNYKSSDYLNWDVREDRRNIIQSSFKWRIRSKAAPHSGACRHPIPEHAGR